VFELDKEAGTEAEWSPIQDEINRVLEGKFSTTLVEAKLRTNVRRLSTQEIVETLMGMRLMGRDSWNEIQEWLAWVWVEMDQYEKHRNWLEVQEKFRFASSTFFYEIAKTKGLSQQSATEYAIKWTLLTNFWFMNVDRPSDKETHLHRLESDPSTEIDLLIREIDRQDQRVTPYLVNSWRTNPDMAEGLKRLRKMQLESASESEMNECWDALIFLLPVMSA
jgi:hypothetical protein